MDPDARLDAYDFLLPPAAIAQVPPASRRESRLFVLSRKQDATIHAVFHQLPRWLRAGDLLVLNDTRVIAARIELFRSTGGRVRGLLLEPARVGKVRVLLEGRGRLRVGDRLQTAAGEAVDLETDLGAGTWEIRLDAAAASSLDTRGRMPLPPYIEREDGEDPRDGLDRERYQTVFAATAGAVAAPTAGLHFDSALLESLASLGVETARVTLHVGLGTFQPVRVVDLTEHRMHAEAFSVSAATVAAIRATRARKGRVIAVGTTAVRSLETWACRGEPDELAGETDLFIRPGFEFRAVDGMITNFHLPKSTLLVLVAAFVGRKRILEAYAEAIASGYRFFSYGDAMLIL